jgi:hypothetical protein
LLNSICGATGSTIVASQGRGALLSQTPPAGGVIVAVLTTVPPGGLSSTVATIV